MPYADLRDFVVALERAGELKRVKVRVSPKYELAAVIARGLRERAPVLLFEEVEGSPCPVLNNPFLSRRHVALALECDERELLKEWLKRSRRRIQPSVVRSGPCKDMIIRDPDLTSFPVPILWHEGDAGPYITFAQFVTRDPETGRRNVGIYRLEIKGKRKLGASIAPAHHGAVNHRKAEALGQPLEFALAIGTEPACYLATQATIGHGEDEYSLASSLRGEPVELVRCETVDLEVPAHAEIVMEGRLLPHEREEEGPFGEWTGYQSGRAPRPVAEISCITHRRDPIYAVTYEGYPVYGPTNVMQQVAREPEWLQAIMSHTCPTVKDVHFTVGGCAGFIVIVSISKQVEGQGKNIIMDLMRSTEAKVVIVVDDDIDVRDMDMVQWALATRMQPAEDVVLVGGMANTRLDPSQPDFPSGVGSKIGIDATRPLKKGFPPLNRLPVDVVRRVDEMWPSYGISSSPERGGRR